MSDLIVLSSVERVPARDDDGRRAYGLNLSVGLTRSMDPGAVRARAGLVRFLQPWRWNEVREVRVFWKDPGGELRWGPFPLETTYVTQAREALGTHFERLESRLGDRFRDENHPFTYHWIRRPEPTMGEAQSWPSFVGDLSREPWPFAQALRLSYLFYFDVDDARIGEMFTGSEIGGAGRAIFAAPILPEDTAPGTGVLRPRPYGSPRPGSAEWALIYQEDGRDCDFPSVYGRTRACRLAEFETPPRFLFDMNQLFVKKPAADPAVLEEDWLPRLEERLAERLDLSRAVLDLASAAVGEKWLRDQRGALEETVVDLLRDFGAAEADTAAPDGSTLRDLIGKTPSAEEWENQLEAAVPAVRRMTAWNVPTSLDSGGLVTELRQLRERVLSRESLVRLVARRFSPSSAPGVEERDVAEVERAFDGRDPVRFLKRVNLGPFWRFFLRRLRDVPDLAGLRENLAEGLEEHARNRLGRVPGGAPAELLQGLQAWAADMAAEALPAAEPRPDERPPGAHGLTLQLDAFAGMADDADDNHDDHLTRLQGVGILMREKGAPRWHCLNLGRAELHGDPAADPVIVPSRLVYPNGLRDVTVTYDNEPLGVPGPRLEGSPCVLRYDGGDTRVAGDVIDYTYSRSAQATIPGLKFGSDYEIVPFLIANCGALPKALTNGVPFQLEDLSVLSPDALSPDALSPDTRWIREAAYRRINGIGPIRVTNFDPAGKPLGEKLRPLDLPKIPPRVHPRAFEIGGSRQARRGELTAGPAGTGARPATVARDPLLLLAPENTAGAPSDFRFRVCKPVTDIHCWDRWVAGLGDGYKDLRMRVWSAFEDSCEPGGLEQVPFTVDDPAVHSLHVAVEVFDESGRATPLDSTVELPCRPLEPDVDVGDLRDPGFEIDVRLEPGAPRLEPGDRGARLRVPEGTVCRLRVSSLVESSELTSRCRGIEGDGTVGGSRRFTSFQMMIETAERLVEGDGRERLEEYVWRKMEPSFDEAANTVELRLRLAGGDDDRRLRRHLHRADVWQQAWSWRGWPTVKHPDVLEQLDGAVDGFLERYLARNPHYGLSREEILEPERPAEAEAELRRYAAWEARAFATRLDDDHVEDAMHRRVEIDPQGLEVERSFTFREPLGDAGGSLGALHRRCSIVAFSRYEGLFEPGASRIQARHPALDMIWRRLFVPCRRRDAVDVPRVKLVLPLTEAAAGQTTPGLLVVLDEVWHESGGLAEDLEASVATVQDPKDDALDYYQMGPDPIFDGAARDLDVHDRTPDGAFEADRYDVDFEETAGPVGHTRERSAVSLPRFHATSFVLPPPRIAQLDDKEVRFDWWMCQVRFRRRLVLGSVRAQSPEVRRSGWTFPYWVQYLPSFSLVKEDYLDTDGVHLTVDENAAGLRLRSSDGRPARPKARRREDRGPGAGRFEPYLVLTRQVFDVAGSDRQEAYVGVFYPDGDVWVADDVNGELLANSRDLRARLIEVQRRDAGREPCRSGEELWGRIFDPKTADRDRARIVRITPPIDAQPWGAR